MAGRNNSYLEVDSWKFMIGEKKINGLNLEFRWHNWHILLNVQININSFIEYGEVLQDNEFQRNSLRRLRLPRRNELKNYNLIL